LTSIAPVSDVMSARSKERPRTSGMAMVSKYSGETVRKSAEALPGSPVQPSGTTRVFIEAPVSGA
jgi:hypothetical protein